MCLLVCAASARAEDGYDLWLRYRPVEAPWAVRYRSFATEVVAAPDAGTAAQELRRGVAGLLAETPAMTSRITRDGAVVLMARGSAAGAVAPLADLEALGPEGYLIRSIKLHGHRATLIAANSDIGVLYGAFAFLRLMQTRRPLEALDVRELRALRIASSITGTIWTARSSAATPAPRSGTGRRCPDIGTAAMSTTPAPMPRIGINGAVLNNVNADAVSLTPPYIEKAAALARRVPALRHQRLSVGALHRADRDRRTEDRRPARSGGASLVAAQGG